MLAYPTRVPIGADKTNGYSVFYHDPYAAGKYYELATILPAIKTAKNYIMEVTAVDLGSGPVLLYWTDVNAATHHARIRGRILVDLNQYSADFDISGDIDVTGGAKPFTRPVGFFYGDYHTASGYVQQTKRGLVAGQTYYHFYPMWVDRTGGARYSHIIVSQGGQNPLVNVIDAADQAKELKLTSIPPGEWKTVKAQVELKTLKGAMPKFKETNEQKEH